MAERIAAFIDGHNLYSSSQQLGWRLDCRKFFIYLAEKYKVTQSTVFIGQYSNDQFIRELKDAGFTLVFRPNTEASQSKFRGGAEHELIMNAVLDWYKYDRAVIVTGDGDLYCLVDHLNRNSKLHRLLVPTYYKYSNLLNRYAGSKIDFMDNLRPKLEFAA